MSVASLEALCARHIKARVDDTGMVFLPRKVQTIMRKYKGKCDIRRDFNNSFTASIVTSVSEERMKDNVVSRTIRIYLRSEDQYKRRDAESSYETTETLYALPDSTDVYFPLALWWPGEGPLNWTILKNDEYVVTKASEVKPKRAAATTELSKTKSKRKRKKHKPN